MKIYTKTGDKGETSLFGGIRVRKSAAQVEAYGSVDELNSWVGLIVSEISHQEKKEFLTKIQSDLFIIGGTLAGWNSDLSPLVTRVIEMEVEIDAMEEALIPLQSFILPGGTKLAATTHLTRSICRKVERLVVGLGNNTIDAEDYNKILQYLNRLSDLFFVLARFINMRDGISDVPWIGIPRKKDKK